MSQKREHNYDKGDGSFYEEELQREIAGMTPEEREEFEKLCEQLEKNTTIIKEGED